MLVMPFCVPRPFRWWLSRCSGALRTLGAGGGDCVPPEGGRFFLGGVAPWESSSSWALCVSLRFRVVVVVVVGGGGDSVEVFSWWSVGPPPSSSSSGACFSWLLLVFLFLLPLFLGGRSFCCCGGSFLFPWRFFCDNKGRSRGDNGVKDEASKTGKPPSSSSASRETT